MRFRRYCIAVAAALAAGLYGQMAESVHRAYVYNLFTGGLNLREHSALLAPNECVYVSNFLFDEVSALTTAPGTAVAGPVPGGVRPPVYEYVRSDGMRWLVLQAGTTLYATQGDWQWQAVKTGLSGAEQTWMTTHENLLWFTNPVDGTWCWDGTTLTDMSRTVPAGRFIASYRGKLWVLGGYENPSYAWFSADGYSATEANAWPGDLALDIDGDNGQEITGVGIVGGYLIVYKTRATYVVYGMSEEDIGYHALSNRYGCVDGGSVAQWRGMLLALDRECITATDGTRVTVVSDKIEPLVRSMRVCKSVYRRWTTTRNDEFNAGTHSYTMALDGAVMVATSSVLHNTTAQWLASGHWLSGMSATPDGIRLALISGSLERVPLEYGVLTPGQLSAIDLYGENAKMTDGNATTGGRFRFGSAVTEGTFSFYRVPAYSQATYYPRRVDVVFNWRYYKPYMRMVVWSVKYGPVEVWSIRQPVFTTWGDVRDNIETLNISISTDVAAGGVSRIEFAGLTPWPDLAENADYAHARAPMLMEITAYAESSPQYTASGYYLSPVIDSGGANTYWKRLELPGYVPVAGTTVSVQTSLSSDGISWDSWVSVSTADWVIGGTMPKRYLQYKVVMQTSVSSQTPVIPAVQVMYCPSPGNYVSAPHYTGGVTAWGRVYMQSSGTVSLFLRTAPTAAGLAGAPWVAYTNGQDIAAASSDTWVQWRSTMTGAYAAVDAVAVSYYSDGDTAAPVSAATHRDRWYLACSTRAAANDTAVVFDRNGAWTMRDVGATALAVFRDRLYAMTTAYALRIDTGTALSARWDSGDLDYGMPNHNKLLRYMYLNGAVSPAARVYIDWYVDGSTYAVHTTTASMAAGNSRYVFPGVVYGKRIKSVVRTTGTVEIHSIIPYYEVLPLR